MNVQNFWHIFCIQYLGRLWYAKFSNKTLTTIEQYRIFFNRPSYRDNSHRNRDKLSDHIELHEKCDPNSIERKY